MLQKLLEDHTTRLPAVLVADAPPAQRDQVVSARTWAEVADSQGVPIGADAPMIPVEQVVRDWLNTGIINSDEIGWCHLWLRRLAQTALPESSVDHETLRKLGRHPRGVFVIDTSPLPLPASGSSRDAVALRVLFHEVCTWLRAQSERPFGMIVFTRKDLVAGSVRQNHEQLLNRYRRYAQ